MREQKSTEMNDDITTISSESPPLSLQKLLENAELLNYLDSLKNVLKLRHAGDVSFTDEEDLSGIGMSRPEQKRLRREYAKHFPGEQQKMEGKKVGLSKIRQRIFGKDPPSSTKIQKNGKRTKSDGVDLSDEKQQKCVENGEKSQQQPQHIIPTESISLCKEIGSGEFGCVYQAAWRKEGHGKKEEIIQVAVKRILPEKLISQPSSFLQEAAIMHRMQHENVVRLYGVVLDTKAVMLVSELAPCGSLLECLQSTVWREQPNSISTLCEFALQISKGMHYLATQRLIHRDLAARNVLVSSPTKVKISDFGLSRSLGHGEDYYRSEFNASMKLPIAWCAPECINFLRFTSASDVWAFGVTLWEMFTFGQTPWANWSGSQILHAIDTQRRKLDRPEACPAEMYQLMLNCWHWEAEKRPTFEQLCTQLPEIFPPILLTVAECRTRKEGHLEYGKGQTIVLLDKKTVYPGFWLGAVKGDKIGIFRPEDTIAYLGAENPSASSSSNTSQNNGEIKIIGTEKEEKMNEEKMAKKFKSKKTKELKGKEEKGMKGDKKQQQKQLIISQPQGDLRHTCHLGADGRSFGLLNVDKNDLHRALPPPLPSPPINKLSPNQAQPPMTVSPLMTASTISLIPPRPPKMGSGQTIPIGNATAMPMVDQMSKSFCAAESAKNVISSSPQSPPPPILPPKPPRFRARPANPNQQLNSPNDFAPIDESNSNNVFSELNYIKPIEQNGGTSSPFPLDEREQQRQMEKSKSPVNEEEEINDGKKDEEEKEEDEEFLRPASICLEQLAGKMKEDEKGEGKEEERIMQILSGLQKDLNEFSISNTSLEDFGDERALLDGERKRMRRREDRESNSTINGSITGVRTSMAFSMEPEEFEKIAEGERRKALKQMDKFGEAENGKNGKINIRNWHGEEKEEGGKMKESAEGKNGFNEDLPRSTKESIGNWSTEADQAYKLLVQCGHLLKAAPEMVATTTTPMTKVAEKILHSPTPNKTVDEERILHSPTGHIPLTIQNPLLMNGKRQKQQNGLKSPIPTTTVEYLNTSPNQDNKCAIGEGNVDFGREYVNTNKETNGNFSHLLVMQKTMNPTQKSPPPVPPKPKIKILATNLQQQGINN